MIPIAKTLQEAINHFLNNNGQVSCENKKTTKICSSLKEANEFFSKRIKKVRNKIRPINFKN